MNEGLPWESVGVRLTEVRKHCVCKGKEASGRAAHAAPRQGSDLGVLTQQACVPRALPQKAAGFLGPGLTEKFVMVGFCFQMIRTSRLQAVALDNCREAGDLTAAGGTKACLRIPSS